MRRPAADDGGRAREILTVGHPLLHRRAAPVAADDPELAGEIADLAATLTEFRRQHGFGRGLAAPQVGISKRLIVLDLEAGPLPLINPEITWRSTETFSLWDDCLSVPDRIARVRRHRSISLHYDDAARRRRHWRHLPADLAELLQHEIDHLDGILMIDRIAGPEDLAPLTERARYIGPQRRQPRITAPGIRQATELVDPVFADSPQWQCEALGEELGVRLTFKVETLNPIRCFKGRGASVLVTHHKADQGRRPLAAASAGNWGQALAYCGRRAEIPITVWAAETANPLKVERMRQLGAEVRIAGRDFDAAKEEGRRLAAAEGMRFVEDGLEPEVTAGHGSMAIELFSWADAMDDPLDALFVPLGNGAMLAGLACWSKAVSPSTRVVGVAAAGAPAMHDSWHLPAGSPLVESARVETIADGLGVRVPIPEAVADLRDIVDDVVLVDDREIARAMAQIHRHAGLVTEPAGAAGLAAIAAAPSLAGEHVATVICGSNLDPAQRPLLADNDETPPKR
ncbi:MAG: pyridoxal-phosphate dependent enzyme [Acidobacteriota bacterium]